MLNDWIGYWIGILSDVVKKRLDPLFIGHSKYDCYRWNCAMSLHLDLQIVGIRAKS